MNTQQRPQQVSILLRIMLPLSLALFALIAFAVLVIHNLQHNSLEEGVRVKITGLEQHLRQYQDTEARLLASLLDPISQRRDIQEAFLRRDREALLTLIGETSTRLRAEYAVTHLYFILADSTCFLRAHHPTRHGDRIDRWTLHQAQNSGRSAHGMELGPYGTLTFRLVLPWLVDGRCIGYLELGTDSDGLPAGLAQSYRLDATLAMEKTSLDQERWSEGRQFLGRAAQGWDRLADKVITFSTLSHVPDTLLPHLQTDHSPQRKHLCTISIDDRHLIGATLPYLDAAGREVGILLLTADATEEWSQANRATAVLIIAGLVLWGALSSLLYSHVRRLEKSVQDGVRQLQERENHFHHLVNTIPDLIWLKDPQGVYLGCNKKFERFFGASEAEIIGKSDFDFMSPELAEFFRGKDRAALAAGKSTTNEEEVTFADDGHREFLETIKTPMYDTQGRLIGVLGISRDITERKQAEEVLRTSEENTRALINGMRDTVWVIDFNGQFIAVNSAAVDLLGYSREELLSMGPADIDPGHSTEEIQQLISSMPHDELQIFETIHRAKNGQLIPVEIQSSMIQYQGKQAILSIARDISERRQAEQSLRESEERFRLAFENARDAIIWADAQTGMVVNCNRSAEMLLEKPREAIVGQHQSALHPPAMKNQVIHVFLGHIDKGGGDMVTSEVLTGSGRVLPVEISTAMVHCGGTTILQGIFRDIGERQQAEANLRASEENLRRAQAVSHTGSWSLDLASGDLTWSEETYRLFGQLPGKPLRVEDFIACVHPLDRQMVLETWAAALGGAEYDIEHRIVVAGEERWVRERAEIRRAADGTALDGIGTVQDITSRKAAEKNLRESEERFRLAFESARDAIIWADTSTGLLVNCNHSTEILLEMPREQIIGLNQTEIHPPGTAEYYAELFRKHRESGGQDEVTAEVLSATGRVIPVEIATALVHFGSTTILQGIFRDISERKRMEGELIQRAQYQRALLDNFPFLVWLKDEEGRFLAVNRPFALACGQEHPGLVIGKTDLDVWPPDLAETYRADDRAVLASGTPKQVEEEIDIAGHRCWYETYKSPVRAEEGFLGTVGFARDITDRKVSEQERHTLQAQLAQSQKLESVARLAGGVAHDFNNKLGVILGYTEMAMMHTAGDGKLVHFLEEIRVAAERSADLTRQMLGYARKQTVSPQELDLNDTVSGMLKMLRRLIGEDITLGWIPGGNLWQVKIDPSQVDQILANLTVNGRDAIVDQGQMTIETANVVFDAEYCARHAEITPGEYVMLAVSDSGCGMSQEVQQHIFEPFYTTKGVGKGTGLGLATVYGIVRQNNGWINVYSETGQGTTIKVYFPRHHGETVAEPTRASSLELPRGQGETVLLVEDEESLLDMGRMMLEDLGYRVLTAPSPGVALRLAEQHRDEINLLLTDVVMPDMNGRELARQLQAKQPELRCIYMSGYTANAIAHHGVLDEGTNFLPKPFSLQSLAVKVQRVLRQGQGDQ